METNVKQQFLAVIKAISFWILWLLLLRLSGAFEGFFPPAIKSCIYGIIGSVIAFGLTWLYLKTEKKTFRDVGLIFQTQTLPRFIYGIIIGAAIFTVMTALIIFFGNMHINYVGTSLTNVLQSIITLFFLALMEEIVFRSYPLLKLNDNFGSLIAQLIAATGFALYHFAIGWNLQTVIMGPFVWAWVYGLAAIWSRGIALPTGLHMMINIGQTLTGMSGFAGAVWKLNFNSGTHSDLQVILIGLHLMLFVVVVVLTIVRNRIKQV